MRLFSGAVLGVALSTAVAHGAALFSFDETGGDVVGTLSGSLDLTGLSSGFDGTVPGGYIDPQLADLVSTAGPLTSTQG